MKNYILSALLLMIAGLQTVWAQKIVLYMDNKQSFEYDVMHLDSIVFVEATPKLVAEIVLNKTAITLQPGGTEVLSVTVLPSDAENKTVAWKTNNQSVAVVANNGTVVALANGTSIITCSATDGSGVKAECVVTVVSDSGSDNHEYVDLGLPSGTLWATCNVGANSPEEYGNYFAWGETEPKSDYSWSTYKYYKSSSDTMTKYCTSNNYGTVDNKTVLEPADDAATANWGEAWQMPSLVQYEELINNNYTTTEWTTMNGVNGRKITSKINLKSIFLPAAGGRYDASLSHARTNGVYWSRSLSVGDSHGGYSLIFYSNTIFTNSDNRCLGHSVRPVRTDKADAINKYCNLPARLIIENVQQASVLYTSCESMGEYCYITSDGQRLLFTDATNHTSSINLTAIGGYSGYHLGLSGFIVGRLTIPEMGESNTSVVCYDRACSNCYQSYNITKPLVLLTGGYAKCNNCNRTYNLNNIGNISDGPTGRPLYRYRVNYQSYVLLINNG